MITLPVGVRVLLATRPVDFRRGAHSLAALAAEQLGENPFSGVVLVFRAKRRDKVKIVHWDATGLVLVWKQLEGIVNFAVSSRNEAAGACWRDDVRARHLSRLPLPDRGH